MPRLLTLSHAARLVGVRRGALQSKIRSGELATFEGMVAAEDLLRAYPDVRLEDHAALERIEAIKDSAFSRRMRERLLPSSEVLLARLTEMTRERSRTEARLEHYRSLVAELQAKLRGPVDSAASAKTLTAQLLVWLAQRVDPVAGGDDGQALLAQESFLRIMTAHVEMRPSGREFFVDGNDSLLEAALRAGFSPDYGCSIGSCGQCKARIVSGQVHRTRHSDYVLTAAEKSAGVVLMCCNTAVGDLVIEAHEAHGAADMPLQEIEARVKSVGSLGSEMRLVHLQTPRSNRLRFLAGQTVSLTLPGGLAATLPVASCPCDDRNLQFHVRRSGADDFAACVFGGLKDGDPVRIEGPRGSFVLDEASPRPLVFIACGTGFAPIKSLIEHAMALDVAETLDLYWVATGDGGHYLDNLCRSWSDALDNFRYTALSGGVMPDAAAASGNEAALRDDTAVAALLRPLWEDHPRLDGHDVYVAGPSALVDVVGFLLRERGLPAAQLFVDMPDA